MSEKQVPAPIAMNEETLLKLVEAMRKPVKTEDQIREEAQKKADRETMGELLKQQEANRVANQAACLHTRRNGTTPAVFVADALGGYFLCQHCRKIVRPREEPDLFNKLMQLSRDDQ
jgi:dTDP-D-glucose 4,6-dehydratase